MHAGTFYVHILSFHSLYRDVNFWESISNIKAFATHLNQIWFVHFLTFPLSLKVNISKSWHVFSRILNILSQSCFIIATLLGEYWAIVVFSILDTLAPQVTALMSDTRVWSAHITLISTNENSVKIATNTIAHHISNISKPFENKRIQKYWNEKKEKVNKMLAYVYFFVVENF